jgi:hypothetical protein
MCYVLTRCYRERAYMRSLDRVMSLLNGGLLDIDVVDTPLE